MAESVYQGHHYQKMSAKYPENIAHGEGRIRLTLPYFACQAKKYSSAPRGCPTKQKLTQKIQFPMVLPRGSRIFSRGAVSAMRGNWNIIPTKATPGIGQFRFNQALAITYR